MIKSMRCACPATDRNRPRFGRLVQDVGKVCPASDELHELGQLSESGQRCPRPDRSLGAHKVCGGGEQDASALLVKPVVNLDQALRAGAEWEAYGWRSLPEHQPAGRHRLAMTPPTLRTGFLPINWLI